MIHETVLFVSYLLTLCNCLLIQWEFLSWKIFFWHGPSISVRPTQKNALWNCLQFILTSSWNPWTISDTVKYSKKFHEPFMASWPPKLKHFQNEETRNGHFWNPEKVTKFKFFKTMIMLIRLIIINWRIFIKSLVRNTLFHKRFHF